MKLYTKLALIILSSAIAVMAVVGIITYLFTRNAFEADIKERQVEVARETIDKLDRLFYERYLDIQSIGDEHDLVQFFSGESEDISELEKRVHNLTFLTGPWDELIVADTDGNLVLSSAPDEPDDTLTAPERTAYEAALAGKVYYSDVVENAGRQTIIFAAPVRNSTSEDRTVHGVVIGVFSWEVVAEVLRSFPSTSQLNLYTSDGRLVGSNKEASDSLFLDETLIQSFLARANDAVDPLNETLSDGKDDYLVSGVISAGYLSYEGKKWILVVETPLEEALNEASGTGFRTTLTLLPIILVIMAAILIVLRRLIILPITGLTKITQEIAKGNLDKRAAATSQDEIGVLGRSFNGMTEKLQLIYTNLDAKVKENTAALTAQVEETNKAKLAVLNLLEDVENEKKKVEGVVIERTRELRDEKARLEASINSLSFGFVIADANDKVLLSNPALREILSLEKDPVSLNEVAKTFNGIDGALIDFDPISSCRECMVMKKVIEIKKISYGKKFLRVFCAPVEIHPATGSTDGAETIGYVFLVEDITEAQVMERSREEFFAVASHELRTPLTSIRGNADMILDLYADKIKDKDMKEMLEDINASSNRLIGIVNDFLEVSRLEQKRMEIKTEDFNIGEVMEKVERDLAAMAAEKGIKLHAVLPKKSFPKVHADKSRTEQVLVNLVGNAQKFTAKGTITVTVEEAGAFAHIQVTDTGTGISEHNQTLLFRKFQQAGEQVLARDVTNSTGLGLYISKLIVSAMGGTILLEHSELGKGSTFGFTLPLAGNVAHTTTPAAP